MTSKGYKKDYEKMFPGVEISAEILKALRYGDYKENYFMNVLKRDRFLKNGKSCCVRDKNGQSVMLPEREVSLDKLIEEKWDFPSMAQSPEDNVIAAMENERLHSCIRALPTVEKETIYWLFFSNCGEGMTEHEYAVKSGLTQSTINSRKKRAFERLRMMLKK